VRTCRYSNQSDRPVSGIAWWLNLPNILTHLIYTVQKSNSMSISLYIDADACPVKQEIGRVAERHAGKGASLKECPHVVMAATSAGMTGTYSSPLRARRHKRCYARLRRALAPSLEGRGHGASARILRGTPELVIGPAGGRTRWACTSG
jgi:hypothetical protein